MCLNLDKCTSGIKNVIWYKYGTKRFQDSSWAICKIDKNNITKDWEFNQILKKKFVKGFAITFLKSLLVFQLDNELISCVNISICFTSSITFGPWSDNYKQADINDT